MNSSQLGGVARARSLSADERSRIARKAARARWADKPGILSREEIKRQVVKMLEDRSEAVAYLLDLMLVEKRGFRRTWTCWWSKRRWQAIDTQRRRCFVIGSRSIER